MLDLSTLTEDGDILKMDDGRSLRLRVEIDQDASINDFDGYGKVSEYAYDYNRDGHTTRPDGFTGNAEKIQVDRGAWMWWEPPTKECGPQRGEDGFKEMRSQVRDLLEGGFKGVILELLDNTDGYGRPIVTNVASLWGIDSFENGYLATVVSDLVAELEVDN